MDLSIIPECYVDTNLIETLVPPNKQYNHQKGCGTVTKVMKEKFTDDFALGIIDKDKKDVAYLNEFVVLVDKDTLFLHKHKHRNHYIIQISPAIEKFILEAAHTANISLLDYGLPTELPALMKVTKSTNSKVDPRFKKLFRDLKRSEGTHIATLTKWIIYLKENRYNIDIELLKAI